jgi:hypothetical protein
MASKKTKKEDKKPEAPGFQIIPPLNNKEDCIRYIRDLFWTFVVIGVFVTIVYYILARSIILDGIIMIAAAGILYYTKKTLVAVIFAIYNGLNVIATVLAMLGIIVGGKNLLLALVVFFYSYYAIIATKRLRGFEKAK